MKRVAHLLALVGAFGSIAACIQQLDSGAAADSADAGASSTNVADATAWELCQSPSCDDPSGAVPFLEQTPVIYLPDGGTTTDPCTEVSGAAETALMTYCGSCHGPGTGAGQGGFNAVMDNAQLQTNTTSSSAFPHYLVPGSPFTSYLYVTVANGTMPPPAVAGGPQNATPSPADISMLYGWIQACFAGDGGAGGYDQSGGNYGPGYEDAGYTPPADAGVPPSEDAATDASAADATGD
jgi:hypothetical protein